MVDKIRNMMKNASINKFVVMTSSGIVVGIVLFLIQHHFSATKQNDEIYYKTPVYDEINSKSPEGTLTDEKVLNFAYESPLPEELVKYSNGKFFNPCRTAPDCDRASIDTFVIADLNFDTRLDAVVWTVSTPGGGNAEWPLLHTVINDLNGVHLGPSVQMEDKSVLQKLMVKNGIITVEYIGHGPNDAICCPKEKKILSLRLINNRLQDEATGEEMPSPQITSASP